jgi:ubiquinone biosynthesis protein COQ9
MTTLPDDPTLDEVRAAIAPELPSNAAFDGWNRAALEATATQLGVDPDIARAAFPGGAVDMIDAWFHSVDLAVVAKLPPETLQPMKIRERITALVEARIDTVAPHREALRRAPLATFCGMARIASARLGWRAADHMWRLAGDTATDYNHYTKRAILGSVYGATVTVMLDDDSEGLADTRAFLSRRIDGIMRFEKTKAQLLGRGKHRPSLSRFIGRLRYPAV